MKTKISFHKMHGLGNDFVVIDSRADVNRGLKMNESLALTLCNRRLGIGADQLLWLTNPQNQSAHVRMEIWDADGSTAEMCGNGVRAIALYLREQGISDACLKIETLAGIKSITNVGEVQDQIFRVDMGPPKFGEKLGEVKGEQIQLKDSKTSFIEVNMGNPHAVIWVSSETEAYKKARSEGPEIERHSRFPHKTNVEFVFVESSKRLVAHVWERGAGITMACGTGACAVAAAAIATNRVQSPVQVAMPGGELTLEWSGMEKDSIFMSGPAATVFHGNFFGKY